MENNRKIELHEEIITQIHDMYIKKNSDYGDSFAKVRRKFPLSILFRLNDKLNRLETLMQGKEQLVKDESIDDTLLDLCGYVILELMERKIDKQYLDTIKKYTCR